jgi:MFS family permease
MYGKNRLLVVVLVLLCIGTAISAVASALPLMLVGRVIQGAAGGIFPLAFGIIRDEFPRERVAGAIGLMSALLGVGGGAGVVLAGPIVDHLSYHYLFWLPLVLLVPVTVAIHFFVPESPIRVPGRVNWIGAALMSVGLAAVLVAVSEAPSWGWGSTRTILALAIGVIVLVAWVWSETRSDHPLVDMRMMRIHGVWTTNTVALLLGFGMYSSFILVPEYVETPAKVGFGFGASVTGAGLFMLPLTVGVLAAGSQTGRLEKWLGSKPPLLLGAALAATSYFMLAFARTERWQIYLAGLLLGAGIGLAFAAMANLIIENVGPAQTGVATGMNTVTRTVGGAFGGAAVASILAGTVGSGGSRRPTASPPPSSRARSRRPSASWSASPSLSGGKKTPSQRTRSAICPRPAELLEQRQGPQCRDGRPPSSREAPPRRAHRGRRGARSPGSGDDARLTRGALQVDRRRAARGHRP